MIMSLGEYIYGMSPKYISLWMHAISKSRFSKSHGSLSNVQRIWQQLVNTVCNYNITKPLPHQNYKIIAPATHHDSNGNQLNQVIVISRLWYSRLVSLSHCSFHRMLVFFLPLPQLGCATCYIKFTLLTEATIRSCWYIICKINNQYIYRA